MNGLHRTIYFCSFGFIASALIDASAFSMAPAPKSPQSGVTSLSLQATNSPVKTNQASFLISSSQNFSIQQAYFWVQASPPAKVTGEKIVIVPSHLSSPNKTSVMLKQVSGGYEADITASELAPGSYIFYLEVDPQNRLETAWNAILSFLHLPSSQIDIVLNTSFLIDASLEVADPGAAGLTTLAGVDSDGDGVRDDVQRWIDETYNSSPRKQAALKQMAKAFQSELLASTNQSLSIQATRAALDAGQCALAAFSDPSLYKPVLSRLEARMTNTKDRYSAELTNRTNFSGQGYQMNSVAQWSSKCNFDFNSLSN